MQKKAPDKRGVQEMFDGIAQRYDFLNHLLTFGIDIWWRKRCVAKIKRGPNPIIVDIATGTGDLALALYRKLNPCKIIGLDLSMEMLEVGKQKVEKQGLSEFIEMRQENCEETSLPDNYCDIVTIGFGIRNFQSPEKGLREFFRILKPKGELTILEFSQPHSKLFKFLFDLYFRYVLPFVGRCVSKHPIAYTYLPQSVETFPCGKAFCQMIEEAGFEKVKHKPLTFGIATVYQGIKGDLSYELA